MSSAFDSHELNQNAITLANKNGWLCQTMPAVQGYARPWFQLPATTENPLRLYISAGIHGDEPASSYAALKLLDHPNWFAGCEVYLFPLLNPLGMEMGTRENAQGIDLNRDYQSPTTDETRGHLAALDQLPRCHIYLHLHEDWESTGAYLYAVKPLNEPSATRVLLDAMSECLPIEHATEIDGFPAANGVIDRPPPLADREDWPEVYYLDHLHGSYHGYTLEAPSAFALEKRVGALVHATRTLAQFLQDNRAKFERR
ncbi:M14 family metallopeptidase [Cerasicoccus frondis]|uniref:M14 family metallopeptidase n=1 Tax=Cerasicoccus frondis TaxID=490090 RepID=UPI002852D782|nr:M14 family metallocarboxypeptidase [Cerasicoccus frondis]